MERKKFCECGNCGYMFRFNKLDWGWYEGREIGNFLCLKCDHVTYVERIDEEVIALETIKNPRILSDAFNITTIVDGKGVLV